MKKYKSYLLLVTCFVLTTRCNFSNESVSIDSKLSTNTDYVIDGFYIINQDSLITRTTFKVEDLNNITILQTTAKNKMREKYESWNGEGENELA